MTSREGKRTRTTSSQPDDFLEYLLFVQTEEQRQDCFRNAALMRDKVFEIFPQMVEFCSYVYKQIDEYQDIDFAHLVLFLVIPQILPITEQIRQRTPPERFDLFLEYLLHCRTNLMNGFTKVRTSLA